MTEKAEEYIAQPWVAPSKDSEMLGSVLLSRTQNLKSEDIRPILEKHGLWNLDPNTWYNMQQMLDAEKEIVDSRENVMEDMVAFGIEGVKRLSPPSDVNTIEKALDFMNKAVPMVNRNIPEGFGFIIIKKGDGHYEIVINEPFPPFSTVGWLHGVVSRLLPDDYLFRVQLLPHKGEERFRIAVQWALDEEDFDR
jgi:hypothetical protein